MTSSVRLLAAIMLLGVLSCGSPARTAPATGRSASDCVYPTAPHRAYVVVTHLDGRTIQRCVGFRGAQVTGDVLMRESGIETRATQMSWGREMCQVDNEPADESVCAPGHKPVWVLFVWSNGWQQAQTALAATILTDGEALGWRYLNGSAVPPPPPSMSPR